MSHEIIFLHNKWDHQIPRQMRA